MNYANTSALLVKRGMDIVGGLVGCLFTLIIMIFVGPMIYIASPGPIFSRRRESAETEENSRCINSAACIWMPRSERKNLWHRIKWATE